MSEQRKMLKQATPFPWQRLAAVSVFGLALLVLGYGFILRPRLSRAVGEQVAAEIRTQLDGQLAAQLSTTLGEAPARDAAAPPTGALLPPNGTNTNASAEQGAQAATALAITLRDATGSTGGAPSGDSTTAPMPRPTNGAAIPANTSVSATALPPTPEPLTTAIPDVIAALPAGEVTLRADSINRHLAERLVGRGPIEDAAMAFVPNQMQVNLRILGTDNQIRAGLTIAGGRVVVRDATLSGPMALAIAVDDLISPIEDQVNQSLDLTGRNLLAVRIEAEQLVVTIE